MCGLHTACRKKIESLLWYSYDFYNEIEKIRTISNQSENYWKEKYYQLLEKHQLLLENKMKIYFKDK
jgi:hypothetical protein